jgi:hypothetical protein
MRSRVLENFCFNNSDCGSRNVPRSARNCRSHLSADPASETQWNRSWYLDEFVGRSACLLGTRPNGSLGILDNNNAQHSTVGRSCLCSSPHQKGRYLRFILGRPIGRPFSWELFATIPLTNDESISTLFRVGKRLHLLGCGVLYLWLIPSADRLLLLSQPGYFWTNCPSSGLTAQVYLMWQKR